MTAAFAVSVAVHAAFVVIYPALFERTSEPSISEPPQQVPVPEGMVVLRLPEAPEQPEAGRPEEPEPIPEATAPETDAGDAEPGALDVMEPGEDETAAERLRPDLSNRDLWAPFAHMPPLSTEQREELLIAGRLEAWYDSVAAADAAASRFTDWTFTDGDGKRWGVADGRLYLGDRSINVGFQPSLDQREMQSRYDEIARQAQQGAILNEVEERAEAIRERRDQERAASAPDTASSTTGSPPRRESDR